MKLRQLHSIVKILVFSPWNFFEVLFWFEYMPFPLLFFDALRNKTPEF